MSNVKDKLFSDEPRKCTICGQMEVWHVYMGVCDVCFVVKYLEFRHAWGWPLDDNDKKRLGLAP